MKVLLVTHFYPAHGGGVERVALELAKRLAADHGMRIVWCASDTDAPPDVPGITPLPMRTWNIVERVTGMPYPLWGIGSLNRLARAIPDADAVHVHDCIYLGSLLGATLARWCRKRLVVTQHIGDVPIRNPLLRPALAAANRIGAHLVLARADAVAFISLVVKAYFEALVGTRRTFVYLPNGVDTARFCPAKAGPQADRAALGFDPARPLLLFVGRFVAKKRLPVVRELAQATPAWQWCLIGSGPEDPLAWGLPNVTVRGPLPQAALPEHYRAADMLVLPSVGEGFPLVVQEAMACGLPTAIPAEVAAAVDLPAALHVAISPSLRESAISRAAIECALRMEAGRRQDQREACVEHASTSWGWFAAAAHYARLLAG